MYKLTYKIAAMTDVGLVRTNNEDNLCVITNLDQKGSTWKNNEVCELGQRGALLVVADGMGGMNAGEVASEIAVSVVKARFTDDIDSVDLKSDESITRFMNESIVIADNTIKKEGKHRPEAKGMGTTIVIAWLLEDRLYVSWCGDSRAYLFNPRRGLVQISKDHSYVQDLVDRGVVSPEDAFDFPESNVITRCLSHSSMKAEPDNLDTPCVLNEGDIVMLCTDGLSGMIRDNKIAEVMADHTDDMGKCIGCLIDAAKEAAGADNVTVCLCQMIGKQADSEHTKASINRSNTEISGSANYKKGNVAAKKSKNIIIPRISIRAVFVTLVVFVILFLILLAIPNINKKGDVKKAAVGDSSLMNVRRREPAIAEQTESAKRDMHINTDKKNNIVILDNNEGELAKPGTPHILNKLNDTVTQEKNNITRKNNSNNNNNNNTTD